MVRFFSRPKTKHVTPGSSNMAGWKLSPFDGVDVYCLFKKKMGYSSNRYVGLPGRVVFFLVLLICLLYRILFVTNCQQRIQFDDVTNSIRLEKRILVGFWEGNPPKMPFKTTMFNSGLGDNTALCPDLSATSIWLVFVMQKPFDGMLGGFQFHRL